jgi:hypothetical protein
MRFEHDLSDNTTIRNTTRWSRVKQDYLLTAVMGGATNITQPDPNDVGTWTWSRLANTKDVSNKILTNQTNLTSKFYTGSIGHDISAGFELTRETQTNYGVYPLRLRRSIFTIPTATSLLAVWTAAAPTPTGRRIPSASMPSIPCRLPVISSLTAASVWITTRPNMTAPACAAAPAAVRLPARPAWRKTARSPRLIPPPAAIW